LITAAIVFLALNPAWWSAPLQVPREVLHWRQELLAGQVRTFGGYTNPVDRLVALIGQPLGDPQYYEDRRGWPEWIGGQIAAYEASWFAGLPGWPLTLLGFPVILLALLAIPRTPEIVVLMAVTVSTAAALFVLTPLPWQRYYLPLIAPYAILCAFGTRFGWLTMRRLAHVVRSTRSQYAR
jgi:hypothetical protein